MRETLPILPSDELDTSPPRRDVAGAIIMWLLVIWIVSLVPVGYVLMWGSDQVQQATGGESVAWMWPFLSLGQGVLLLLPLFPLARFWSGARYRAIFETWGLGAAFLLVMGPLRLVAPMDASSAAAVQCGLLLLFIAIVIWLLRTRQVASNDDSHNNEARPLEWGRSRGGAWPAFLLAPLAVYSWLALSAFGSPLDMLLNGLAALLFGLAVGLVVGGFLLPTLYETSTSSGWSFTLGGFAIGVLLLIMSVGFGFQGVGLLLMFCLPALGWAAIGLSRIGTKQLGTWPDGSEITEATYALCFEDKNGLLSDSHHHHNWLAVALFVGLVAAAPMMLVDPDELLLVLNIDQGEVMAWSFRATGITALVGWLLAVVGFVLRERLPHWRVSSISRAGVVATWLVGGVIYALVGQPGFHGDRLFVILKDQADLSEAAQIADIPSRRAYVFETLTSQAEGTQRALRSALDQFAVPYQPYYLVNALEVEGGPLHRWWLESRPEVARVLDSPVLRPLPEPLVSAVGEEQAPTTPQWNLTLIGAERVWNEFGVTGEGIMVGQSDSGVQGDHPEFSARYAGREAGHDYNWFDPWNHTKQPTDIGGHGTHTLGSVLGKSVGVAPGAEWIGCVNLGRNLANPALYLDCLQFMLAPFPIGGDPIRDGEPSRAADVLNNSWGCPAEEGCDPNALQPAVSALRAAGIFVVASAGNEGSGCSTVASPIALYDEAFSVGAVNSDRQLADFSSRGPVTADGSGRIKPDIVAPGVNVLSAYPNSTYQYNQGTSMAGPHIVGVVALIWSANPDLIGDIDRTEQLITDTAQPASGSPEKCGDPDALPNNGTGYGLVDAYEAVKQALEE
ncbi:MAG: S8 family serine peptidase [Ardenticatenaceae bacterium]